MTGIVLIGGQSSRMGQDKSMLLIGDQPLYKIAAEKIAPYCDKIFLSANQNQISTNTFEYPTITDIFDSQGPIAGIISCHRHIKEKLLIISCDIPLISQTIIRDLEYLHESENGCTMFYNVSSGYYEPMLSIWEVNMLDKLEKYFVAGGRSMQEFLHQNVIIKNSPSSLSGFKNVNTQNDWRYINSQH